MTRTRFWMFISGLAGFLFFLFANGWLGSPVPMSNVTEGCIQITLNVFVFVSYLKGRRVAIHWVEKVITTFGVVTPVVVASITLVRVIIPALFSLV